MLVLLVYIKIKLISLGTEDDTFSIKTPSVRKYLLLSLFWLTILSISSIFLYV